MRQAMKFALLAGNDSALPCEQDSCHARLNRGPL